MKIRIDNFEGPLDLLLQLIEKEEMDITEVSLLQVAEQYLDYLDTIEDKKPDELADFLLIAAKLLYIKSKALLPGVEVDEEEAGDLAEQLRMYKKYVEASRLLEKSFEDKSFAFSRQADIRSLKVDFEPPASLNKNKLKRIFAGIVHELEVIARLPRKSLEKVVSIKEKIKQIQELLAQKSSFNFNQMAAELKSRTEIIVSFLGLLELSKQREVHLEQLEAFGDIYIKSLKS